MVNRAAHQVVIGWSDSSLEITLEKHGNTAIHDNKTLPHMLLLFHNQQKLTWFFVYCFQMWVLWVWHCPNVSMCSGNEDGEQVWVVNPKNKLTPRLWSADDKIVVIKDVWPNEMALLSPKKCAWLWKLNVDVPLVYHTFASWGGSRTSKYLDAVQKHFNSTAAMFALNFVEGNGCN